MSAHAPNPGNGLGRRADNGSGQAAGMSPACSKGYFGSSGKRVNTTTPPLASSSFKVTLGIYVNELH